MAKVDGIKEEIGWLKLVFGVLVAIDASVVGWLVQNQASARRALVLAAVTFVLAATAALALVNRVAYRRIKELKEL